MHTCTVHVLYWVFNKTLSTTKLKSNLQVIDSLPRTNFFRQPHYNTQQFLNTTSFVRQQVYPRFTCCLFTPSRETRVTVSEYLAGKQSYGFGIPGRLDDVPYRLLRKIAVRGIQSLSANQDVVQCIHCLTLYL